MQTTTPINEPNMDQIFIPFLPISSTSFQGCSLEPSGVKRMQGATSA